MVLAGKDFHFGEASCFFDFVWGLGGGCGVKGMVLVGLGLRMDLTFLRVFEFRFLNQK